MGVKLHFYSGDGDDDGHVEAGPFDHAQLTYHELRVGDQGETIAFYAPRDGWVSKLDGRAYTDIVLEAT